MEPYVGEIRCFSFSKIPSGWLPCSGQTLQIQQNAALYSLLGTQFGGDGRTNFNLPNLNGTVPVHIDLRQAGSPVAAIGGHAGAEQVTLTGENVPAHLHAINVSANQASQGLGGGDYWAVMPSPHLGYRSLLSSPVEMAADAVSSVGAGQSHPNMQPSLALNFCIATVGYYPPHPS